MTRFIENQYITAPLHSGGDGLMIFGRVGNVNISNCVIDFSAHPVSVLDEALSGICAAQARVLQCRIRGAGKLVLWGNGEHPDEDRDAYLSMTDCILSDFGRRGPEAQDGASVVLRNCVIRNWGIKSRFDVRCFGAWAHHGAHIEVIDCVFEQTSFWQTGFWNFWKDIANHIGQAVNYRGVFGLTWRDFIPGVCRGLTACDGGTVRAVNCRKNKWWIRIEGQNA